MRADSTCSGVDRGEGDGHHGVGATDADIIGRGPMGRFSSADNIANAICVPG